MPSERDLLVLLPGAEESICGVKDVEESHQRRAFETGHGAGRDGPRPGFILGVAKEDFGLCEDVHQMPNAALAPGRSYHSPAGLGRMTSPARPLRTTLSGTPKSVAPTATTMSDCIAAGGSTNLPRSVPRMVCAPLRTRMLWPFRS
ncbi:hypothetical protein FQZ97_989790 [compost metagenome]